MGDQRSRRGPDKAPNDGGSSPSEDHPRIVAGRAETAVDVNAFEAVLESVARSGRAYDAKWLLSAFGEPTEPRLRDDADRKAGRDRQV